MSGQNKSGWTPVNMRQEGRAQARVEWTPEGDEDPDAQTQSRGQPPAKRAKTAAREPQYRKVREMLNAMKLPTFDDLDALAKEGDGSVPHRIQIIFDACFLLQQGRLPKRQLISDLASVFRHGMAPVYQTAIQEITKKNMDIFRNHAAHYLMGSLSANDKRRALDAGITLDGIPSGAKYFFVESPWRLPEPEPPQEPAAQILVPAAAQIPIEGVHEAIEEVQDLAAVQIPAQPHPAQESHPAQDPRPAPEEIQVPAVQPPARLAADVWNTAISSALVDNFVVTDLRLYNEAVTVTQAAERLHNHLTKLLASIQPTEELSDLLKEINQQDYGTVIATAKLSFDATGILGAKVMIPHKATRIPNVDAVSTPAAAQVLPVAVSPVPVTVVPSQAAPVPVPAPAVPLFPPVPGPGYFPPNHAQYPFPPWVYQQPASYFGFPPTGPPQ